MKLSTNEMIGVLTEAIMRMEELEIAFYEHVAENVDAVFLKDWIETSHKIASKNSELLAKIGLAKSIDKLRFLDEKPFRIAILRLKAAVLQAEAACGETVAQPD